MKIQGEKEHCYSVMLFYTMPMTFTFLLLVQTTVHQSTRGNKPKSLHILYAHCLKVVLHDLFNIKYIDQKIKKSIKFIVKSCTMLSFKPATTLLSRSLLTSRS